MTGKGDDQPVAVEIETKGATLTKARFTFNPDQVLEVGDAELTDAKRGGFLYSYDHGNTPLEDGLHPWRGGDAESLPSGVITDAAPAESEDDKKKGGK